MNGKGRDSVGVIATRYGLEVRVSNPVGARFSVPIQTSQGAYPASYTAGTGRGRGLDHPPPSSAEAKERI